MRQTFIVLSGLVIVFILFVLDVTLGSVTIPVGDVFEILTGGEVKKGWEYIVLNFRLPKALTAILVGAGVSVAGLQMQTLFRNPLAGPSVLGITHGASLGVAIFVLASSLFFGNISAVHEILGNWGIILFAVLGSLGVLFCVVLASSRLSGNIAILIVGMMFGFITGSIVSILQSFSSKELIHNFIVWTFGSLSGVAWEQMRILAPVVIIGLIGALMLQKGMNALLLGEQYATGAGINVKRLRLALIATTSVLAGTITAFTGPIAFIGIAVPHLARLLFKTSNHKVLIPGTMLTGVIIMLVCDLISQLPGHQTVLPINSITALFGAPVILAMILNRKKMKGGFDA